MAAKSPPLAGVPDPIDQSRGTDSPSPVDCGEQNTKEEPVNESAVKPHLAIPKPIREEQVENAVKFLSHPKVRGSPVIYRRSFLERKGLTKEEIEEAFRRVPDSLPSNVSSGQATASKENESKPVTSLQHQAITQTSQPAAGPTVGAPSLGKSRFQWSTFSAGLLVIGFATCGAGAGFFFKKVFLPRLKGWIRKVVAEEKESFKEDAEENKSKKDRSKSNLVEEAAEAAKAAASAAAMVAKASQDLITAKQEERKFFKAFMEMMDVQVKEMKSMSNAMHRLETTKENAGSDDKLIAEHRRNGSIDNLWMSSQDHADDSLSSVFPKQVKINDTTNGGSGAVGPSSASASVEPLDPPPHPKSYMEIMAMIERGEKPPRIKEINDMPPIPDQQPSKPLVAWRPKPWEIPQQAQQRPNYGHQFQMNGDISGSDLQENGHSSQLNGTMHDASEPWWAKKAVKISEIEPEVEETRRMNSYGIEVSRRSSQRGWVPPQPPAVVMPEAAAAIRQPKPSVQTQQLVDKQLAPHSEDGENGVGRERASVGEVENSSSAVVTVSHSEIPEKKSEIKAETQWLMSSNGTPSQRGWVPAQPPAIMTPTIGQPNASGHKQHLVNEHLVAHSEDGGNVAARETDSSSPVLDVCQSEIQEQNSEPKAEELQQVSSYGTPSQGGWVLPQPLVFANPETAAVVQQPKAAVQIQQSGYKQLAGHSQDWENGVVRGVGSLGEGGSSSSAVVNASHSEIQEVDAS